MRWTKVVFPDPAMPIVMITIGFFSFLSSPVLEVEAADDDILDSRGRMEIVSVMKFDRLRLRRS